MPKVTDEMMAGPTARPSRPSVRFTAVEVAKIVKTAKAP
jgi:hypothetical protein